MRNKALFYYVMLCSILCACLAIAAGLGSKIILVYKFPGSATLLAFSITFWVTDVISEIFGKKAAKKAVWVGFWAILLVFILIKIAIIWPSAPFWKDQAAYERIFGGSLRIIIGGIIAYLVSQFHDVWAYHFWKKRFPSTKFIWLRNNASTIVSQLIDSIIFTLAAFAGKFPASVLFEIVISTYLLKVIVAVVDTPFIYLAGWIKKKWPVGEANSRETGR